MAIVRMKGVREMNDKDLGEKLKEMKLELSKDRASSEIGTVKNPGRIRELRRSIARILTEKNQREKSKAQDSKKNKALGRKKQAEAAKQLPSASLPPAVR